MQNKMIYDAFLPVAVGSRRQFLYFTTAEFTSIADVTAQQLLLLLLLLMLTLI